MIWVQVQVQREVCVDAPAVYKVSHNVYWNSLCKAQHCWLVLSMSSKSDTKNGTHCRVPEILSITAAHLIRALVQIFENFIGCQFYAVPQKVITSPAIRLASCYSPAGLWSLKTFRFQSPTMTPHGRPRWI